MNKKNIIIVVLIITSGVLASCTLFDSEEKQVKERFVLLSQRAEKTGEEPVIKLALRARSIGELFAHMTVIEADNYDLSGDYRPENITSLAAGISTRFKTLSLKFYDIRVEFPSDSLALSTMTASLEGIGKVDGSFNATEEIEVELVKEEGEWLFSRISMVEVLEK